MDSQKLRRTLTEYKRYIQQCGTTRQEPINLCDQMLQLCDRMPDADPLSLQLLSADLQKHNLQLQFDAEDYHEQQNYKSNLQLANDISTCLQAIQSQIKLAQQQKMKAVSELTSGGLTGKINTAKLSALIDSTKQQVQQKQTPQQQEQTIDLVSKRLEEFQTKQEEKQAQLLQALSLTKQQLVQTEIDYKTEMERIRQDSDELLQKHEKENHELRVVVEQLSQQLIKSTQLVTAQQAIIQLLEPKLETLKQQSSANTNKVAALYQTTQTLSESQEQNEQTFTSLSLEANNLKQLYSQQAELVRVLRNDCDGILLNQVGIEVDLRASAKLDQEMKKLQKEMKDEAEKNVVFTQAAQVKQDTYQSPPSQSMRSNLSMQRVTEPLLQQQFEEPAVLAQKQVSQTMSPRSQQSNTQNYQQSYQEKRPSPQQIARELTAEEPIKRMATVGALNVVQQPVNVQPQTARAGKRKGLFDGFMKAMEE